jgi:hypothetical protein
MNTVIVGKTNMNGARCVGGITFQGTNVRLLDAAGRNQPVNTPFEVGQIWDLDFAPRQNCRPPHVEDVLVAAAAAGGVQQNLRDWILAHDQPWIGSVYELFGGLVAFTNNGSGYISDGTGLPARSTGFWIPDAPLTRDDRRYIYNDGILQRRLTFVGVAQPVDVIPQGSLVRVSLARWWRPPNADPDFEERCYVQLSGWYL